MSEVINQPCSPAMLGDRRAKVSPPPLTATFNPRLG